MTILLRKKSKTSSYTAKFLSCLVFLLLTAFYSNAATRSWKGTGTTLWATGTNWTGNTAPVAGDNVIIGDANMTGTTMPTLSTTLSLTSLTLGPTHDVTLTVGNNALTVSGVLTINAGSILSFATVGTTAAIATVGTTAGTGLLKTVSSATAPLPTGETWNFEVEYARAGNQTVSGGTYNGGLTISGTGTKSTTGTTGTANNIAMGTAGVLNISGTLALLTPNVLSGTIPSTSGSGLLSTTTLTTTSATPIPANKTWSFNITYSGLTNPQTVVAGTYNGDLNITGSGTKNASGDVSVVGILNVTSTLAMGTNQVLAVGSTNGAGTLTTGSTDPAPIPTGITWAFNVTYTGTTQNVSGGTYNNDLTLSATSGTKTVVGGNLIITTGNTLALGANTLDMGANALSVAASPTGANAIIKTASTATAPITANITWIPEIDYTGTGQNVVAGTYSGDLVITGTGTAKGIIAMGTTGNLTVNGTLDMSTFTLTGTLPTITGTGLLKTAHATAGIPTGKTWPFTIEYSGTTQTLVSTTSYTNLTISGSGVKTAGVGFPVTGVLDIETGCTLNMATFALTGAALATTGTGLLKTSATGTAIPTSRTWTFDVEYSGAAQSVMAGNYNGDLNITAAGTKNLTGAVNVGGDVNFTAGTLGISTSATANTLAITGNFNQNSGSNYVDFNTTGNGQGTIAIKGNLTQTSGFMVTSGSKNGILDFNGAGSIGTPQIINISPTTTNTTNAIVPNSVGIPFVNIAVESGTVVQLNSDVQLNQSTGTTPGTFTVKTGGTLNLLNSKISMNTAVPTTGIATVIISAGATVMTANVAGINSAGTSGAIQTSTSTMSLNSGANYEFDAATGNTGAFTTTTNPQVNNLTIKSTGTVTAGKDFTVNGTLGITGTLDMATFTLGAGGSFAIATSGTAALKTANITATPLPADKAWPFPITYNSAGVQTIVPGTYNADLTMSSVGVKTFAAGTINVATNWLTSGGLTDLTTNAVSLNFTGASAQAITDNTAGTVFKTVGFSGGGKKTLGGTGKFSVSSAGTLTMAGSTELATAGLLRLKSDATGSAMVAAIPSGASITGDVLIERFMYGNNDNARRGYRLMSSPTHDGAISATTYNIFNLKQNIYISGTPDAGPDSTDATKFDLSPNHGATIYHYYEPIAGLQNSSDFRPITLPLTNDEFTVGEGMFVFYRGIRTAKDLSGTGRFVTTVKPEDNTVVFKGTLNQGHYSMPLSYTNSGITVDGFNLLGNPYPATIDISTSLSYTGSVDPFIYEIDPGTKAYCAIKKDDVANKTGNASQYIASGQGFFVRAIATGASVDFDESGKVAQQLTTTTAPKLLMSTSPMAAVQVPQILKLKMINPADSTAADDIAISFYNTGKVTYDRTEDAIDFGGNGTVALSSFSSDNVKLAINTYPAITTGTKIKLGAVSLLTGNFNMVASNLASLDSKYQAKLIDNYKADTIQLSANSTYAFTVDRTIPATYADGRFEITFAETPITINPILSFTGVNIKKRNDLTWKVNANPLPVKFTLEKSTNNINFSVLTTIVSDSRDTYTFSDDQPVKGDNYYRLGQTDVNNHLKYADTINVKYKDGDDDGDTNGKPFKIYPQPVVNNLNIALNQDGDDYKGDVKIKIMDLSGQVIKKANFNGLTYSMDLSKVRLGLYVIELSNDKHVIGQTIFIKL
jgi:hypothetical protein